MSQSEDIRLRCSYYDALAAIGLMKGVPMIDVACDDALISALMEMELACVRQVVDRYDRQALGYPTAENVAALAAAYGGLPATPVRRRRPPPYHCTPVHTIGGRLRTVIWGMVTGVASALVVGLVTSAPWAQYALAWLIALLSWLIALPGGVQTILTGPASSVFLY